MANKYADIFKGLSLHDADLIDVSTTQNQKGDWALSISVRVESGRYRLIFNYCRYMKIEIKGGVARADVIVKADVSAESDVFKKAGKWPAPLPPDALHYSLLTNSGSVIDVVSEKFEAVKQD